MGALLLGAGSTALLVASAQERRVKDTTTPLGDVPGHARTANQLAWTGGSLLVGGAGLIGATWAIRW